MISPTLRLGGSLVHRHVQRIPRALRLNAPPVWLEAEGASRSAASMTAAATASSSESSWRNKQGRRDGRDLRRRQGKWRVGMFAPALLCAKANHNAYDSPAFLNYLVPGRLPKDRPMPRYFLHIRDVCETTDTDGIELAGCDEARTEAIRAAGEALKEYGAKFWQGPSLHLSMKDESGETVCHFISKPSANDRRQIQTEALPIIWNSLVVG